MSHTFAAAEQAALVQKRFLYRVYAWMGGAILLTAFAAFFTAQSPALLQLIFGDGRGFPCRNDRACGGRVWFGLVPFVPGF